MKALLFASAPVVLSSHQAIAFTPIHSTSTRIQKRPSNLLSSPILFMTKEDDDLLNEINAKINAPPAVAERTTISSTDPHLIFPVVSKIAGREMIGSCRYVNTQLTPMTNLKLSGGVKYEINGTSLTLSSYLTFPNGQTRNVIMKGTRKIMPPKHDVLTLLPIDEEGPIIMKLSEVYPDTILINEIEKDSGRIIMTSSLNIVKGVKGLELVGVSHEVGNGEGGVVVEGHQVWRMTDLTSSSVKLDEFDYRSATSW